MIIRNISYSIFGMIFFIVKLSANVNVKINVHPKKMKSGDDLIVECLIYNSTTSDRLKTFFYCPFTEKNTEHCYADCASICQHIQCTEKSKFIDNFKCSWDTNQNPRRFIYKISSLTKEQINNRKILSFSCKYMGLEVRENVTVVESSERNIPNNGDGSIIITTKPNTNNIISNTKDSTSLSKDMFNYGARDIVLIALGFSLLTSFFINIWCCVQWCISRGKYKKRKQVQQNGMNLESSHHSNDQSNFEIMDYNQGNNDENIFLSMVCQEDNIRRAKSQPALLNNGKNNHVKASASNLNKISGSMNNNARYRYPIYNSSINGIYQNGSIPEQMYPYAGQQIIGCLSPQYIPPYHIIPAPQQFYRMNTSQSEDLNEFAEDLSDNIQSSTNQPLPRKPDDHSLNLESTSSSLIV